MNLVENQKYKFSIMNPARGVSEVEAFYMDCIVSHYYGGFDFFLVVGNITREESMMVKTVISSKDVLSITPIDTF